MACLPDYFLKMKQYEEINKMCCIYTLDTTCQHTGIYHWSLLDVTSLGHCAIMLKGRSHTQRNMRPLYNFKYVNSRKYQQILMTKSRSVAAQGHIRREGKPMKRHKETFGKWQDWSIKLYKGSNSSPGHFNFKKSWHENFAPVKLI